MALTSDDVNFLVYRYLQESGEGLLLLCFSSTIGSLKSPAFFLTKVQVTCLCDANYSSSAGFSHSSFVFGYEAFVHRTNIGANQVPPGALVSFLQRGIQYVEMQSNLNEVRFCGASFAHAWYETLLAYGTRVFMAE